MRKRKKIRVWFTEIGVWLKPRGEEEVFVPLEDIYQYAQIRNAMEREVRNVQAA